MAWPIDRLQTFVDGVTALDADFLNELQDSIRRGAHGMQTLHLPATFFKSSSESVGVGYGAYQALPEDNANTLLGGLELPVGAVITEIRARLDAVAGNTLRIQLVKVDAADASSTLGSSPATVTASPETVTLTGPFAATLVSCSYFLRVDRVTGASNLNRANWAEVDWYLP